VITQPGAPLADHLHTSSDGQKFEVRVDSLNATTRSKYFGKDQGVAAYTFRDDATCCGTPPCAHLGERESPTSSRGDAQRVVRAIFIPTDAFGFSELVFAVSHLLGFSTRRGSKISSARGFISSGVAGVRPVPPGKIKPAGYADDEIVIQQWDESCG